MQKRIIMRKIDYDIKYDKNDDPYIVLGSDYEDTTEDKFMIFYLATNLLEIAFENNLENGNEYDEAQEEVLENAITFLSGITYELSHLLKEERDISVEIEKMTNKTEKKDEKEWDVEVNKVGDRDNLPDHNIIYKDGIFERKVNDFKVYVKSTKKIYNLVGGITNNHWKEYKKE